MLSGVELRAVDELVDVLDVEAELDDDVELPRLVRRPRLMSLDAALELLLDLLDALLLFLLLLESLELVDSEPVSLALGGFGSGTSLVADPICSTSLAARRAAARARLTRRSVSLSVSPSAFCRAMVTSS